MNIAGRHSLGKIARKFSSIVHYSALRDVEKGRGIARLPTEILLGLFALVRFSYGPSAQTVRASSCRTGHAAKLPVLYVSRVCADGRAHGALCRIMCASTLGFAGTLAIAGRPAPPPVPFSFEDSSDKGVVDTIADAQ